MSVLEIQQALKAAGFDPGALDGKMGPHTRSAIEGYQRAHGLTADGIAGPKTQAALQGSGGAATGAASPDQQADQQIATQNPTWAFLLNDVEIGPILRMGLPADQLEMRIKQTDWYRTRTDAERNYLALAATDPKEATRRLNNYDSIAKYIKMAGDYGQQVSFEAAARQVDRVVRGDVAPDALEQELRIQAKALFPYLATQIDQGSTVGDVWEPVKNIAANVLGVNPASVQLSDTKWSSLLQTPDGKGGFRLPSQAEVEQRLRTDSAYGYLNTQNGRDDVSDLLGTIHQGFGLSS